MDLVQTVRKEGSRGGRGEFSWDDVKASAHRENYLGHSLMAPVGRWQSKRDLSWYAKTNSDGQQMSEAEVRREEIRQIKEAEADALARALGYEVPPRLGDSQGDPNLTALGGEAKMKKSVEYGLAEEDLDGTEKGLGYGTYGGKREPANDNHDFIAGNMGNTEKEQDQRSRNSIRHHSSYKTESFGPERPSPRSKPDEGHNDRRRRHRHHHERHIHNQRRRSRSQENRERTQHSHRHDRRRIDNHDRSRKETRSYRHPSRSRSPTMRQ